VEEISAELAENKRTQLEEKLILELVLFSFLHFFRWDEVWELFRSFSYYFIVAKNPPLVDVSRY
jgi:hypothetical protein